MYQNSNQQNSNKNEWIQMKLAWPHAKHWHNICEWNEEHQLILSYKHFTSPSGRRFEHGLDFSHTDDKFPKWTDGRRVKAQKIHNKNQNKWNTKKFLLWSRLLVFQLIVLAYNILGRRMCSATFDDMDEHGCDTAAHRNRQIQTMMGTLFANWPNYSTLQLNEGHYSA